MENIKQGFKRLISWKKYRPEITTQTKYNNLDDLIDPTFRNIVRLLFSFFKNNNDDPTTDFFYEYYMALVEIKDFNALIDKIDYRIGNLLDYFYHQKYYKLIGIDLLRQQNSSISQKLI